MPDFIKDNWFVVLVAVIVISFVGYFIYDGNRYNVSSKTDNGQKVIASLDGETITAEDFFNEEKDFDGVILYNLYRNAVVNQSIEETKDIKNDAKNMEASIRANFKNGYGDNYEASLYAELANYGLTGDDALYQYCLISIKEKEMNRTYVDENYDELKEAVEGVSPRTISYITMAVADPTNLSDDEKSKQKNIDKEIKEESFAKAATAFSEDTNTAGNKGYYGYIDATDLQNGSLDAAFIQACLDAEKGKTTDWITVTDYNTGATTLYKGYVEETDIDALYKSEDKDVADQTLYAFIQNNKNLEFKILEQYASKLDIEFNDKDVKKRIDAYIEASKEGDE